MRVEFGEDVRERDHEARQHVAAVEALAMANLLLPSYSRAKVDSLPT